MCEPVIFENITAAEWDAIEKKLVGQNIGVSPEEEAADAGEVIISGAHIDWRYDAATQVLTVTCTQKPFVVSCGAVNSRIRKAFAER